MLLCGGPTSANPYGIINGRVVDFSDAARVTGATIEIDDARNLAEAEPIHRVALRRDGSFTVVGISETDVIVTVRAPGFAPLTCPYQLSPGGELRATFRIVRVGTTVGRVASDENRCPIAPVGGGQTQDVYVLR